MNPVRGSSEREGFAELGGGPAFLASPPSFAVLAFTRCGALQAWSPLAGEIALGGHFRHFPTTHSPYPGQTRSVLSERPFLSRDTMSSEDSGFYLVC